MRSLLSLFLHYFRSEERPSESDISPDIGDASSHKRIKLEPDSEMDVIPLEDENSGMENKEIKKEPTPEETNNVFKILVENDVTKTRLIYLTRARKLG